MNHFSGELCWILTHFKSGAIDFGEADIKIRDLIGSYFGMSVYKDYERDLPSEKAKGGLG